MSRGKVGMEHAVMAAAQAMERVVDEQLASMEDVGDDDLKRLRMERVRTMKKKKEDEKKWREREHGVVQDLPDEKAFFDALKGEERFVCHFYRENRPCKVLDMHLQKLASKHMETKFARIDAEKSPFLTQRLNIWMLPTLAVVLDEKATDYVVGLDAFGGGLEFPTEALEDRLLSSQALLDPSPPPSAPPAHASDPDGPSTRAVRTGRAMVAVGSDDESSDFSS